MRVMKVRREESQMDYEILGSRAGKEQEKMRGDMRVEDVWGPRQT